MALSLSFVFILRWVKDQQVASRLKEVWLNITKIVGYWEKLPASSMPSSKSYLAVKKGIEGELLVWKLSLFIYIASLLQPYLTKYQTDDLMLLILVKDLERLHRSFLQLVIKPDVLEKCESPAALLQIDFSDKSIYLHFQRRRNLKIYNDKIKYLHLMSKLLKKKLLL